MNNETGKLSFLNELAFQNDPSLLNQIKNREISLIEESMMTEKQKNEMQVSKFDNKSELGKMFTGNRYERRKQMQILKRELKKSSKNK